MKYAITGTDWSSSKNEIIVSKDFILSSRDENAEGVEDLKGGESASTSINPYDYFEHYKSLFGVSECITPVNLGVYREATGDGYFHSTQFVGLMPLINKKDMKPLKVGTNGEEVYAVKISSRFHISPSKMLKCVLEGDDYYENPDMLQCKSYKISELRKLFGRGKKNKVLCGTVTDIGKVYLEQEENEEGENNQQDSILNCAYAIFEVISFINLAKEVCKKSLKQQSRIKEENLVGKVKGRILVNKQIKYNNAKGQYQKVYCAYNTLSENIKENEILKYTLHLCGKLDIADSLREDIMFCNRVLANVPLKKCTINDFMGIKNNGAFRQYKQALEAAKAIIKRYYISYDNVASETGSNAKASIKVADYAINPYFIDMNLLFEYYCRALFRKAINQINMEDNEYVLALDSATRGNIELFSEKEKLKRFYMETYIPDILVKCKNINSKKEDTLTVIDAKYSDVENSGEKRARTHQVMFYLNVLDCLNGGLISPYTGEECVLCGKYIYNGNKEARQNLCYIPLGKISSDISENYVVLIKRYLKKILDKYKKTQTGIKQEEKLKEDLKKLMQQISENVYKENGNEKLICDKKLKQTVLDLNRKYQENKKIKEN